MAQNAAYRAANVRRWIPRRYLDYRSSNRVLKGWNYLRWIELPRRIEVQLAHVENLQVRACLPRELLRPQVDVHLHSLRTIVSTGSYDGAGGTAETRTRTYLPEGTAEDEHGDVPADQADPRSSPKIEVSLISRPIRFTVDPRDVEATPSGFSTRARPRALSRRDSQIGRRAATDRQGPFYASSFFHT